jgi:hypothetical protein
MLSEVVIRSSVGTFYRFRGEQLRQPVWLWGAKTVEPLGEPLPKYIVYAVSSVKLRGANIVNEAQQRFIPAEDPELRVELLFYSGTFAAHDAIFGFPAGSAIRLKYPDGHSEVIPLGAGKEVTLHALPRGEYEVTVRGKGLRVSAPVSLTRSQRLDLKFVTWLDLGVVALAVVAFLAGLPWLRRRLQRATPGGQAVATAGDTT